jgi:radical SAM protein with 4Fe4S-binding SPASM domain
MEVVLTDNPSDRGKRLASSHQDCACDSHQDCACDCQCACPTDGAPTPVLSLPVAYYLELTSVCNNRCPGCGNVYAADRAPAFTCSAETARSPSFSLNGIEWCDLISLLAPHAHCFKLTGGEPVLHPAFAEIVHTIENRGIPFTLFTNGRWPHPDGLVRLLCNLASCEGLLVSLHGPDEATHEAFSGMLGSFAETVSNIRRVTDAGLDVATSFVINCHNWDRIAESLDLALGLGANHVVCNRFIGAPLPGVTPSQSQLRAAIATVESLRAAGRPIRFGNCIPQCFAPSSSRGCTAGSTFATVDPWGRMRPCNHAPLIAGDLRAQRVEEVWQSEAMAYWRSLVPGGCMPCSAFATCHGGCRAQALLTGRMRDSLIRAPLIGTPLSSARILLYAGLRPVGEFALRQENDATVLIRKSQVVTVPVVCDQLVSDLNGSLTLREINRQYGNVGVDWIGALHQEGMVRWGHRPRAR